RSWQWGRGKKFGEIARSVQDPSTWRRIRVAHGNRLVEDPNPTDRGRPTMDNEPRLDRALARRNRTAWAAMYDRHSGVVFGLIYHLVGGDRAVAEDVHQEVWLLAIEQVARFDPARGEFRDWLLGIARHRALRRHRRPPDLGPVASSIGPPDPLPPPEHL